MASSARAIPEGYRSVTPYLIVQGAARAIDFYKAAFDAKERMRVNQADGRIGHAEITVGDSMIMLADEFPEHGIRGPRSLGGSPVTIHLYVEDVDATVARAVAAGAQITRAVQDQFYGDRSGSVTDPFGHVWAGSPPQEDVAGEERARRTAIIWRC